MLLWMYKLHKLDGSISVLPMQCHTGHGQCPSMGETDTLCVIAQHIIWVSVEAYLYVGQQF